MKWGIQVEVAFLKDMGREAACCAGCLSSL